MNSDCHDCGVCPSCIERTEAHYDEETTWETLMELGRIRSILMKIDTMPDSREETTVPCADLRLLARHIYKLENLSERRQ